MRRGMGMMLGMFVMVGALGCSGGSMNATPTQPLSQAQPQPQPQPPASGSGSVGIVDFSFGPQDVTIAAGGTVTWTNNGGVAHTATSNGTEFDSGNLGSNASFSHTFNTKGTYAYHCAIHASMTGTVTVQ